LFETLKSLEQEAVPTGELPRKPLVGPSQTDLTFVQPDIEKEKPFVYPDIPKLPQMEIDPNLNMVPSLIPEKELTTEEAIKQSGLAKEELAERAKTEGEITPDPWIDPTVLATAGF
jgi:hypothetical protein